MKNKFSIVFALIMFGAFIVWNFFSGISGLMKTETAPLGRYSEKGTLCEIDVSFAKEVYEIEHMINGIIPSGSEHFYLAITAGGDAVAPMLVKAKSSWFEENFSEDGSAVNGSVAIIGEIKKFDSSSAVKLKSLNAQLSEIGESVSTALYADTNYRTRYTLQIVMGIAALSVAAVLAVLFARIGTVSHNVKTAACIYIIIAGIFCIGLGVYLISL
ncbi:MAG: hypothetical protein K2G32_04155 [Oscillospiraceae bacterium]|nr:hypothetical protein [Oscillospiraceae bacterium]